LFVTVAVAFVFVSACVPYNGNEQWTRDLMTSLNVSEKEGWRAWEVNNQVAGYVTSYELNNFTFLTVKGAGVIKTKTNELIQTNKLYNVQINCTCILNNLY
jgi:hypothetical protein